MIFAHFFYLHCMESANRECTCFESTDILFWVLLFMLKNAEMEVTRKVYASFGYFETS